MPVRHLASALLSVLMTACSGPSYYLQAMSGHWGLMRDRQDISSLIEDPATDPRLGGQLRNAEDIKVFAEMSLDLPAKNSYTSYVQLETDAVTWNVIATPEFSLEARRWCFPVAGCLPYRGYFEQDKALDSAERLGKKGMDVFIAPATAYSSLGWFDDPLLSTMLNGSDTRLAAIMFHELAHQRVYLRHDAAFSEAYANFVAREGVRTWLASEKREDDLKRQQQFESATVVFAKLVTGTRESLTRLYGSDMPVDQMRSQKTGQLESFKNAIRELANQGHPAGTYFHGWTRTPVNNARLALYDTYDGGACAFQNLFSNAGRRWPDFHRLAKQVSRLDTTERKAWLNRGCADTDR
jgi:predicted aminopeptidase